MEKEMTLREQQKQETKRRIYDCAIQLFSEKSYDEVKISDIAKAANVSAGSIYFHYTSKGDIIDEGYHYFDLALQQDYEKAAIAPGKESILYLIRYQVQNIIDMGYQIATISFKNQLGNENHYLLSRERYLYAKLLENASVLLDETSAKKLVDILLRTSRGTIYDWCLRIGAYDLVETTMEEIEMILQYFDIK